MGYLLKEALKTLCGVNQWSYAVFWKIGCQNPKLLTCEECYYGPASCSGLPEISGNGNSEIAFQDCNSSFVSAENLNLGYGVPAGDKVHLLVNKMMMDNHVNIVGEGLVGRVAFTGSHQWILSENYHREAYPPEVLKDVCQQFSAGMQTVIVIPVLPHGVVQFGSYLTIMENMGFVNDVVSLVLQLGCIPGVLQSENYAAKELAPELRLPICPEYSTPQELPLESNMSNSSSFITNSFNYVGSSVQTSVLDSQISYSLTGEIENDMQFINGVAKAEVIPSNANLWMNQNSSQHIPRSIKDLSSSSSSTFSDSVDHLTRSSLLAPCFANKHHHMNPCKQEIQQTKINPHYIYPTQHNENLKNIAELVPVNNTNYYDACVQAQSGDDLFDILGADFKNKLFTSCCSPPKKALACSEVYSNGQENSGIFSSTGTDQLLDDIVSTVQPSALDGNISCRTTLTNMSSSSVSTKASLPYGCFGVSKGELLDIPKYLVKSGPVSSSSLKNGSLKEDSGSTYSKCSSIYDSWIEKGHNVKQNNSVATGYSNKPHETNKTNRKRLKPGENPRPRPKDRQMIQDRVKELREIVPNGAKCSIDALLERSIKHMLFLQSVTKHADKLNQTLDSKIISKDGGLLLQDNIGGATWAYEVGSQSMVCPIIIEDLNQPRQMLVEMLCEERGLFLEIADIIRGLGLTILKGFMLTRNDKIWARFTVEANRDVTRMEVFLSLVRLLEQNAKGGVTQPNNISNNDMLVQEVPQVATAPATGFGKQITSRV